MTSADPRSFDHLVTVFERYSQLVGAPLRRYLTDRLPPRGERALDLGVGTGQHAVLLAAHFDEVLGVDLSEPMLAHARQHRARANVRYEHRDLTQVVPDLDGTFDLVFSAHTLHHVGDLPEALARIRGLVRPGGQVILVDNVDPRRQAPRGWFVREAIRGFATDLRRRRRPVREAVEVFRLATDPAWLDHVTSDVFLSPEEFAEVYGRAFPGAEFTALYRARAVCWRS